LANCLKSSPIFKTLFKRDEKEKTKNLQKTNQKIFKEKTQAAIKEAFFGVQKKEKSLSGVKKSAAVGGKIIPIA